MLVFRSDPVSLWVPMVDLLLNRRHALCACFFDTRRTLVSQWSGSRPHNVLPRTPRSVALPRAVRLLWQRISVGMSVAQMAAPFQCISFLATGTQVDVCPVVLPGCTYKPALCPLWQ